MFHPTRPRVRWSSVEICRAKAKGKTGPKPRIGSRPRDRYVALGKLGDDEGWRRRYIEVPAIDRFDVPSGIDRFGRTPLVKARIVDKNINATKFEFRFFEQVDARISI